MTDAERLNQIEAAIKDGSYQPSADDVCWLIAKYKEAGQRLHQAQGFLEYYQRNAQRQYQDQSDYLPYHEDEYDR